MIKNGLNEMVTIAKGMSRKLIKSKKGSGIVEVLMIIAIVVIVGAIVIALLKTFVPEFFNGLIAKARQVFEL